MQGEEQRPRPGRRAASDAHESGSTGAEPQQVRPGPAVRLGAPGRAVSRDAGAPWAGKMLTLPAFLAADGKRAADCQALSDGFRLTAYFLERHVCEPRGLTLSSARDGFVQATLKALAADDPPTEATA